MRAVLKSWIRWLFGRKPYNGMVQDVQDDRPQTVGYVHTGTNAASPRAGVFARYRDQMSPDGAVIQWPHCDPLILHAPGSCAICDKHSGHLQRRRVWLGMNFTGEFDPQKKPDPATQLRQLDQAQAWHGNAPQVEIIVNDKRHLGRSSGLISYADVVEMAYGFGERRRDFTMTVRGRTESKSMLPGDTVKVQDGMVFDVSRTNGA